MQKKRRQQRRMRRRFHYTNIYIRWVKHHWSTLPRPTPGTVMCRISEPVTIGEVECP